MSSSSRGNNRAIHAYFGRSRECAIYTLVLTFSTFIFVASMILTVFLTHNASMDKAVVVLIVGSCLLYLLGFCSNMYSIYRIKPTSTPAENADDFSRESQIPRPSAPSTSLNVRSPDIVSFPRARELFRKTPPPPYEVQMSEMSRMLQPGTTEQSEREAEIAEEARKLIQRLYEEMRRTDQLASQFSSGEQSTQQVVKTPKPPVRRQEMMSPKVSHQNLVVQRQQAVGKSSPSRGLPPVGFRANQAIEQKVAASSFSTQLDLGRLVIGSEGCSAVPSIQSSPRISSRPPVDCRTNQVVHQKATPNSYPTRPDLEKFIITNEGCAVAPPQLSPRTKEFLKVARKRKLTRHSQELQSRSKTKGNTSLVAAVDKDSQNNEYEEIEVVGSIRSTNSSQAAYDSIEDEFEDPSEQTSVISTVSPPGQAEPEQKFGIPSVKARRQLSMLSTRKFCQLGQSPETVLDAIATCFDLTPDEWMVAWKLGQQNVPPEERARILGVCLQEDSYNIDN